MIVSETKAKGELSVFTEGIWRFYDPDTQLTLVPDGTFNILVINDRGKIGDRDLNRGVYFIPVLNESISITANCPMYGLRLKIFSLHNLIQCNNLPISKTREIFKIDLSNQLANYVHQGTHKAESLQEAMYTLENLNYELIHKHYKVNPVLRDKVNYILDRRGDFKVNEMAATFNVSRQALHKTFQTALGIGPKELGSIWRVNYYLWKLNKEDSFTSCAFDAGYYDQAHSIKDFQSKFGDSPRNFLSNNADMVNYIHFTIQNRFNNFYDPDLIV
ncbi:MAG: helix-turn-helix domain-containing protein [Flavobacteriales bacterium]|nr:helix-turn-helix domain-containing protein [Flavobacteriales bacterium]MCB9197197.1 helix-turn-helix domain-containing protein [Flavobacteriales bacterium]